MTHKNIYCKERVYINILYTSEATYDDKKMEEYFNKYNIQYIEIFNV